MRYESLIFDIDGTLWDSRALVAEGYNIQLDGDCRHDFPLHPRPGTLRPDGAVHGHGK